MKHRSLFTRMLRTISLSPYDWRYTLQLPFYFLRPGKKNYTHLTKIPCQHRIANRSDPFVKLMFAGDIMQLKGDVVPRLSAQLQALIGTADYFIANCEAPIVDVPSNKNSKNRVNFAMPLASMQGIMQQIPLASRRCILTVANNHSRDQTQAVFDKGIKLLQNKLEVQVVGNMTDSSTPYITVETQSGVRIAIAAWTHLMNGERFLTKKTAVYRPQDIVDMDWHYVKRQDKIDFMIGLPHWDREYQFFPCQATCDLAHQFMAQGFDMLIGSHSHIHQPIELIGNKLCCYSMGNFCGIDKRYETKLIPIVEVDVSIKHKQLAGYHVHYFVQAQQDNQIHLLPLSRVSQDLQQKYQRMLSLMYQM